MGCELGCKPLSASVRKPGSLPLPVSEELLAYSMIGAHRSATMRATWDDKFKAEDLVKISNVLNELAAGGAAIDRSRNPGIHRPEALISATRYNEFASITRNGKLEPTAGDPHDALLHVARGLAYLEQTRVRFVVNRVGVDARPGFRLWREDFFDGLTHRRYRRDSSP